MAFAECMTLYPNHMCDQFNAAFANLIRSGLYTSDQIPQLQDVSKYLRRELFSPQPY